MRKALKMPALLLTATVALLSALMLSACGVDRTVYRLEDDDEVVSSSSSSQGYEEVQVYDLKNRELTGGDMFNEYSHVMMRVAQVDLVLLDSKYAPVDTVEVTLRKSQPFVVGERSYEKTPYVQFIYTCAYGDSAKPQKLQFSQYYDLLHEDRVQLNLFDAMASDRVQRLISSRTAPMGMMEAKKKAADELANFLNWVPEAQSAYALKYVLPYAYTRFFSVDSSFYGDFKKLSAAVGKKENWYDVLSAVGAADALMSYDESLSSDSVSLRDVPGSLPDSLVRPFNDLCEMAYRLPQPFVIGEERVVNNSRSLYDSSKVVCDVVGGLLRWRLMSPREEELGACTSQSSDVIHEGKVYYCYNRRWQERPSASAFERIYGKCTDALEHKVIRVGDELRWCHNGDWKYAYYGESAPYVFDFKFSEKFGKCSPDRNLEKVFGDSVAAQCVGGLWVEAEDEAILFADSCKGNLGKKYIKLPNSHYYACTDNKWSLVTAPEYYGEYCTTNGKLVLYDNIVFKCNGTWKAIPEDSLLTPQRQLDACLMDDLFVRKYGDVFYKCSRTDWNAMSDSSVLPPLRDGVPCEKDKMISYEGKFYVCAGDDIWHEAYASELKKYEQELSMLEFAAQKGFSCDDGLAGSSIHWLGGENYKSCDYSWTTFGGRYFGWNLFGGFLYDMRFAEAVIENGVFTADSNYVLAVNDTVYTFSYSNQFRSLVLKQVKMDGKVYDAYAYRNRLFIHGERGTVSKPLQDVASTGEGFEEFRNSWLLGVILSDSVEIGKAKYPYASAKVNLLHYDEQSYVDYETASGFCPQGFHIPDSTEWMSENFFTSYLYYDVENSSRLEVQLHGQWGSVEKSLTRTYDIFWSGTEKDADTQYCFEIQYDTEAKRIIECPKTVKPMIQVMCVEDSQGGV